MADTKGSNRGTMAAQLVSAETVEGVFSMISVYLNDDLVKQIGGVFVFDVKGEPNRWYVDLKNGKGSVGKGDPPQGKVDVTFVMERDTFIKMFTGKLNPTSAFMAGKLSLKGDLPMAMRLDKLMGEMRSKL
ncbi:hydroxysteroid dehydrogenase-like protein 2 isoform X2 [Dermacentor silvarum]|nr:hydroxysteroid dehydrogenase-like protein 2 isoform X2 [Dermacentor silvarum]